MIKFVDGPAAGVSLTLGRAPIMLRVVRSADGKWDALDQLSDVPASDETIHVYRLIKPARWVHVDGMRNGRRFGQTLWMGEYRVLPDQPGDATTRTKAAWSAWCEANKEELLAPYFVANAAHRKAVRA